MSSRFYRSWILLLAAIIFAVAAAAEAELADESIEKQEEFIDSSILPVSGRERYEDDDPRQSFEFEDEDATQNDDNTRLDIDDDDDDIDDDFDDDDDFLTDEFDEFDDDAFRLENSAPRKRKDKDEFSFRSNVGNPGAEIREEYILVDDISDNLGKPVSNIPLPRKVVCTYGNVVVTNYADDADGVGCGDGTGAALSNGVTVIPFNAAHVVDTNSNNNNNNNNNRPGINVGSNLSAIGQYFISRLNLQNLARPLTNLNNNNNNNNIRNDPQTYPTFQVIQSTESSNPVKVDKIKKEQDTKQKVQVQVNGNGNRRTQSWIQEQNRILKRRNDQLRKTLKRINRRNRNRVGGVRGSNAGAGNGGNAKRRGGNNKRRVVVANDYDDDDYY